MVATAVLSLGIVAIYQALFITLDAFNYCANYLEVVSQVNERIWQTQEELRRFGPEAKITTAGTFPLEAKRLDWELSYVIVDIASDLYKIDLTTSWKSGRRIAQITRTAYALSKNEESEGSEGTDE